MNLVFHIQAGVKKWSPTSTKIESLKVFVHDFLHEKTGIRIDFPNSQGGTSTTGNVARECFSPKCEEPSNYLRWTLTLLPNGCRYSFETIHSNLGFILRVYNSDKMINEESFETICKDLPTHSFTILRPMLHQHFIRF